MRQDEVKKTEGGKNGRKNGSDGKVQKKDKEVINIELLYDRDINAIPLLTAEEERELGWAILEGREAETQGAPDDDERIVRAAEAKNELVNHNLRLVRYLVKTQYNGSGLEDLELVQEGNLALMEAAKKFDVTKNVKFSTFATTCIRRAVQKAKNKKDVIGITYGMQMKISAWKKGNSEWEKKYGYAPDDQQMADYLKWPLEKVKEAAQFAEARDNMKSLDVPVREDIGKALDVADASVSIEDDIVIQDILEKICMRLTEREQEVWESKRVGKSYQEICLEYQMPLAEVKKIISKVAEILTEELNMAPVSKEVKETMKKEAISMLEEERSLSTGETIGLNRIQSQFNVLFEENGQGDLISECWDFDFYKYESAGSKHEDRFFKIAGELKDIPSYKYVVLYLMDHYGISIGEKNMKGLWNFIDDPKRKWSVAPNTLFENLYRESLRREDEAWIREFDLEDYQDTMTALYLSLKRDYEARDLLMPAKAFTQYFYDLINKFNKKRLQDLALATDMDPVKYQVFLKKVLKQREYDFYEKEDIKMYLALRYAKLNQMETAYQAYLYLSRVEAEPCAAEAKTDASKGERADTVTLQNEMLPQFSEQLKNERADTVTLQTLLQDHISRLEETWKKSMDSAYLRQEEELRELFRLAEKSRPVGYQKKKAGGAVSRRPETIYKEQWEKLKARMDVHEKVLIDEMKRLDKNNEDGKYVLNNQDMYRCLYGKNVINPEGTTDLSDENMKRIYGEKKECILDSQMFLDTRLRKGYLASFPKDERKQRNALLTVIFLNFAYEIKNDTKMSYKERLGYFESRVNNIFSGCGFGLLNGGNAYDAFLKLLLSCRQSVELYKYIWSIKTDSYNRK